MTINYDTFEFSGDSEWALWRRGVMCAVCFVGDSGYTTEIEAIGLAVQDVTRGDDRRVEVTPVCETCVEGPPDYGQTIHSKTIVMFGEQEDN